MLVRRVDDPLWKSIIEETSIHFLEFFYPEAISLIDFNREIVYLDKEFAQLFPEEEGTKGTRYVDKLLKVFLRDGSERYILIHVEVQSNKGKGDLAKRMFQYFYRIIDKYDVPITAIAILADPQASYRPSIYVHEFLGTRLSYQFNHYKILDQEEAALRANPNPFAVVVLTVLLAIKNRQIDDAELMSIKLDLYKEMQKREMTRNCRKGIYDFLTHYLRFQNKEMYRQFETTIEKNLGRSILMGTREYLLEQAKKEGFEIGNEQGIEIGIEQGKLTERLASEGKFRAIAHLLKGDGYINEEIASLTGMSTDEIDKL